MLTELYNKDAQVLKDLNIYRNQVGTGSLPQLINSCLAQRFASI